MTALLAVAKAQDISALPVIPYPAKMNNSQKAFVLYLSGDGGENTFSKSLAQQLNDKGYPVAFFNCLKYFWTKKTPDQAAADIQNALQHYRSQWNIQRVIVIGYSFGADITPFVVNRFSKDVNGYVKNIVLLSVSRSTDFEVHVMDLFGKGKKRAMSVTDEINKLVQKPLLILHGEDEDDKIEPSSLKVPYKLLNLKGGHKFDSNTPEVVDAIVKNL